MLRMDDLAVQHAAELRGIARFDIGMIEGKTVDRLQIRTAQGTERCGEGSVAPE